MMLRYLLILAPLCALCPKAGYALEAMDDAALSSVSGQDGLTITVGGPSITANSINFTPDAGTAQEANLRLENPSSQTVDATGATLGAGNVALTQTFDAGELDGLPALSYTLGVNRIRLRTDQLRITTADPTKSFGTWALDFSADMKIVNQGGFFNESYNKAYVKGEVYDASLFYRQLWHAHSYMVMNDLHAMWEMPSGTLGINNEGIIWKTGDGDYSNAIKPSDLIDVALDFEYLYNFPNLYGEGEFQITQNARGLMHFGWLGSLKDVDLKWRPGGIWSGTKTVAGVNGGVYDTTTGSGGLNLSAAWDLVSLSDANALGDVSKEFRWRLGETSDAGDGTQDLSRQNFELGDWTMWGARVSGQAAHNKPQASYFPMIAFDVINGASEDPGGLCWGFAYNGPSTGACSTANNPGYDLQYIHLTPGTIGSSYNASLQTTSAGGLAIIVRDGQLQAFARRIKYLERDATGNIKDCYRDGAVGGCDIKWGLIYALANVDANFILYPGGNPDDTANGSRNYGIIADILLMSQTFDENDPLAQGFNWDHGTHLMIADTDLNGNGVTGETRDAEGIGFLSSSFLLASNDTRIWVKDQWDANDYYQGGLDFASPEFRFNYKATFGGGVLPDNANSYGSGPQVVKAALVDLNMEGAADVRFSPSNPADTYDADGQYSMTAKNYLGYSAVLRAGTIATNGTNTGWGSYLSLAEPSSPDVAVRFANVTGDVAFTNGIIDVRAPDEDGDNKPKLIIANNMLIGAAAASTISNADPNKSAFKDIDVSAYGAAGQQLDVGRLMLGDASLGRIVIPSAKVYSSISLMPQTP